MMAMIMTTTTMMMGRWRRAIDGLHRTVDPVYMNKAVGHTTGQSSIIQRNMVRLSGAAKTFADDV